MNFTTNLETLKADCAFVNQLPSKYVSKFCKLAVRSIIEGTNEKLVAANAKQLEQDQDTILSGIRALSQIFTMFSSYDTEIVNEIDFNDGISMLELKKDAQTAIYQTYCQVHILLRDVINDFKIETPIYQSFDWRLDIEIASRSLHRRADPKFLCQLQTRKVNKFEKNDSGNNNNDNNGNNDNTTNNEKNENQENDNEKKIETSKEDSKDEFSKDNDLNTKNENNNKKKKITSTDKTETTLFECNFANLENTIKQLETAIQETKQRWYKQVSRQTK